MNGTIRHDDPRKLMSMIGLDSPRSMVHGSLRQAFDDVTLPRYGKEVEKAKKKKKKSKDDSSPKKSKRSKSKDRNRKNKGHPIPSSGQSDAVSDGGSLSPRKLKKKKSKDSF